MAATRGVHSIEPTRLREKLLFMKSSSLLADVTIKCHMWQIPAHRCVLSVSSGYFQTALHETMLHIDSTQVAHTQMCIDCSAQTSDVTLLDQILAFMYSGAILVTLENFQEVLRLGLFYQIDDLINVCTTFINVDNCLKVYLMLQSMPAIYTKPIYLPSLHESVNFLQVAWDLVVSNFHCDIVRKQETRCVDTGQMLNMLEKGVAHKCSLHDAVMFAEDWLVSHMDDQGIEVSLLFLQVACGNVASLDGPHTEFLLAARARLETLLYCSSISSHLKVELLSTMASLMEQVKIAERGGDNLPSCGDTEPSSGDSEPSCGDNEPSCGDSQHLSGDNEPSYGDSQHLSGDNEPSCGVNQHLSGDNEPSCGDSQHLSGDNEPSCGVNQHLCGDNEPSCGDSQHLSGDNEPLCGDNQHLSGDNEPLCGDSQHLCGDNEPSCGDSQHLCGDNEPSCGDSQHLCGDNEPSCGDSQHLCGDNNSSCGAPLVPEDAADDSINLVNEATCDINIKMETTQNEADNDTCHRKIVEKQGNYSDTTEDLDSDTMCIDKDVVKCDEHDQETTFVNNTTAEKDIHTHKRNQRQKKNSLISASTTMMNTRTSKLRSSLSKTPRKTARHRMTCPYCDQMFKSFAALRRHQVEHVGIEQFACNKCENKQFDNRHNLVRHLRIHSNVKPFKCGKCPIACRDMSALRRHEAIHTGEKKHECEFCHKLFSRKAHLATHRRRHTGEKPFKCDDCDQSFTDKRQLVDHNYTHNGTRFTCDLCTESFVVKRRFLYHKLTHSDKNHRCEICSKTFLHKHILEKHYKVHDKTSTSEVLNIKPPLDCPQCKKTFCFMKSYIKHMARHKLDESTPKIDRSCICDVCGVTLTDRAHFKDHLRIHTGERPYICQTCGRSFRVKGHLTVHARQHSGERPFVCKWCGKGFRESCKLVRHRRIHTGQRPYVCDVCQRGFTQNWNLKMHKRSHTSQKDGHLVKLE